MKSEKENREIARKAYALHWEKRIFNLMVEGTMTYNGDDLTMYSTDSLDGIVEVLCKERTKLELQYLIGQLQARLQHANRNTSSSDKEGQTTSKR